MNNLQISAFEEKVRLATQTPDPRLEFAGSLWEQIKIQPQRQPSWGRRIHKIFASRPAWTLAAGVLLVLFISITLAGPQRVLAALQSVLGYIPGVGFVSTESGAAMREPVELTQNNQTFRVEQLLRSNKEVVLVLRLQGFPAYQNVGLDRGLSLIMADGNAILPHSFAVDVTGTPGEYTGVFKFFPLPAGTRQVTVSWRQTSGAQSLEPVSWQVLVTLYPISDPDVAKLLPNSYEPEHASAAQLGITLTVDQVSNSASDMAVRLQSVFPPVFNFASPSIMVLTDELGRAYQSKQGQVHFEDNGQAYQILTTPGPTPQVFRNLHETLNFQAVDPTVKHLTLQVKQLNFRASPYAAFSIDLGSHPSIGDHWPINQVISVGDLSFRVNGARMVALDKDAPGSRGRPWIGLVLDLSPIHPDQVQLSQIWLRVWGAQEVYDQTAATWAAAWLPDQVPSGTVEIHLDAVQGILNGDWEIQWIHQIP